MREIRGQGKESVHEHSAREPILPYAHRGQFGREAVYQGEEVENLVTVLAIAPGIPAAKAFQTAAEELARFVSP